MCTEVTKYRTDTFLPPANEVWGKVIFLHLFVILFTGGSTWAGAPEQVPPGRYTPPGAVHAGRYGQQAGSMHPTGMHSCYHNYHKTNPPRQVIIHPPGRYSPRQVHPPPPGRYTPQQVQPPAGTPPPGAVHAGRYGQQAGGTHPTGMHSCYHNYHKTTELSMLGIIIGKTSVCVSHVNIFTCHHIFSTTGNENVTIYNTQLVLL